MIRSVAVAGVAAVVLLAGALVARAQRLAEEHLDRIGDDR